MKDIKIFLIGFLTCACLFLIMGQTENEEYDMEMNISGGKIVIADEYGRYQGLANVTGIYMIDTTTGDLYIYKEDVLKEGFKRWWTKPAGWEGIKN